MKPTLLLSSVLVLGSLLDAQMTLLATALGNTTLVPATPPNGANTFYFDINVTATPGILVSQLDVNITNGGAGNLDLYVTAVGNSFVPFLSAPAAWTLMGTAPTVSLGDGVWSPAPFNKPFFLATGVYGVALHHIGMQCRYTSPAATTPLTYNDANLTLDCTVARVRNSTPTAAFTGGTSAFPRVASMRWNYTTGAQVVEFSATPTRGNSPLTVQFTNRSVTTLTGGILAYAWDFDNDNVVDSTQASPTWVYNTCGDYTVKLTIVDTQGPHSITKPSLIQTDLLAAGFTARMVGANTLQFTDTTTPAAANWAWDLNGDTVIDSNLQNPLFVYPPNTTEVLVTLTVSRACRAPVTLRKYIAVADALETRFDGNTITTTTATGGANFFDLNVTNPDGIVVSALHVHSSVLASSPVTVNVWVTPTTYVGAHLNGPVWRQVATAIGTSRGVGQRTFVQFPGGFYLAQGAYGVAVEQIGASPVYISVGSTQTFTNADASLTAGLVMESPVFTTGAVFNPRVWNGAIYYTRCNVVPAAGYGFFAPGCAGTAGIPGNAATSLPKLGQNLSVSLTNLAGTSNVAFFVLGASRTASSVGPLPVDLAVIGAPGCLLRTSLDLTLTATGTGGTALLTFPVPNIASLLCGRLYTQALGLDAGANGLGATTSDAAAVILGQ